MSEWTGKRVVVIGAGKSGQAAARLAADLGARVSVSERSGDVDAGFRAWMAERNFPLETGGHTREFVTASDEVVTSPGVRPHDGPAAWARRAGIPVIGEIELAARVCPAKIIAVTGSNGKTTVTTLIGEILKTSGAEVFVGGNIGHPFAAAVQSLTTHHWAVLELSSFQLQTVERFHPHIAVWLNFSQNHLDYHTDLNEYFQAKARMFSNQTAADFAVLNANEPRFAQLAMGLAASVHWFEAKEEENPNHAAVKTVAQVCGVASDIVQKVLAGFRGVEHRCEWVRTLDGVDYINDSKSTTTESGRWALTQTRTPIVLICGGRDKNLDFSVLQEIVGRKVKRVVAFGEARDKLAGEFSPVVPVAIAGTLDDAVLQARAAAVPGDTVLFSPMCASFDMFDNFEHRGRVFKELVNGIKK